MALKLTTENSTTYRVDYEVVNTGKLVYAPGIGATVTLIANYSDWSDIPNILAMPRGLKANQIKVTRLVLVED